MIKVLIADDNLYFTKFLINSVLSELDNIQIVKITTNGSETIDFISKNQIDLVFLDLQMPNLNGIEVLQKITFLNAIKLPKFIVISGDIKLLSKIREYNFVYNIIQKNEDLKVIKSKIKQIVDDFTYIDELPRIREKIVFELSNMGYNIKHQGTRYLMEAILFAYEKNDFSLTDNLVKNIYYFVAEKNKKTVLNIQTNITKASKRIKSSEYLPKYAIPNILTKIR